MAKQTRYSTLIGLAAGAALVLAANAAWAGGDPDSGKKLSETCAACHGPDGNGVEPPNPTFPIIAGQYADYIVRALEDYKTGKRQNAIMAGFAAGLSKQDREDLAAYFSSQESKLYTIHYADE